MCWAREPGGLSLRREMDLPPLAPPPSWTVGAFVAIVLAVVVAFVLGARATAPPARRTRDAAIASVAAIVWLAITAAIPASGVLARDGMPPPLMVFFVANLIASVALALSPVGRRLAALPSAALVGVHAFRLPLEVVLERWAAAGTIPVQMSMHGDNYDVITGVAAIVAAIALARRPELRRVEIAFQVLGLALLARVVSIAVTSAPGPLRSYSGEPLLLGLYAPYAWIVSVCVAGALSAHLIGVRRLLARAR